MIVLLATDLWPSVTSKSSCSYLYRKASDWYNRTGGSRSYTAPFDTGTSSHAYADEERSTLIGMKTDRGVIQLARDKLSVKQIAAKMKLKPEAVIKMGRRLGIYFPPLELKRSGRRKTKRT